jgi:transglutaminase-like putative cysteine protease
MLAASGVVHPAHASIPVPSQAATAPAVVDSTADVTDYDLYYAVVMDGKRAGWMRSTRVTEGDRITSSRVMHFRLRRGQTETTSEMSTRFIETSDGKPIEMRSVQRLGAAPITVTYTFADDGIGVVSENQGRRSESRMPLPSGTWLTPSAAADYVARRLKAGAEEIVVKSLDPLSGPEIVTTTHGAIRAASEDIGGTRFEGYTMTSRSSNAPGVVGEDLVDSRGLLVRQKTSIGALSLVIEPADESVTRAETDAPEVMVATFVKPDRKILDPRRVARATYLLEFDGGDASDMPVTGSQSVERVSDRARRVTIDATFPNAASADDDAKNAAYMESSAMIDAKDEKIRALALEATKGRSDAEPIERAEACRSFVSRFVSAKHLGTGLATASETAATRSGDCTEHAVLLAAMLRVHGIPSRIAAGLIYADAFAGEREIFGYHMWTQALIEIDGVARWVDLDPTLSGPIGYDATHVALVISALSDADGADEMIAIGTAMGRLKIRVEDIEHRK